MIRVIIACGLMFYSYCGMAQTGFIGVRAAQFPSPLMIMAGESNGGGVGQNDSLTAHEAGVRNTKIFNNSTMLFEDLDIGTNNLIGHVGIANNSSHGLENGIANSVEAGVLGNPPAYILKSGFGGARIKHYNDSTDITYMGQNAWQIMKPRVDSAIKLMNVINGQPTRIFLIWTQGINDYDAGISADAWKDSTKSFFVKARLRWGQVPIFILKFMPPYNNYDPSVEEICSELPECYSVSVTDAPLKDNKHWNYSGFKIIAARVLAAIKAHYTYY